MGSASSKVASPCSRPANKSVDEKTMLNTQSASTHSESVPKSGNGSIQLANIDAWESTAAADPKIQLARTILTHNNIKTTLTSREAKIAIPHVFNTEVELKTGPVTDQKSSGRCWLFATTNIIRYEVMKKLKLSDFQCSQVRNSSSHLLCPSETLRSTVIPLLLGQAEQVKLLPRAVHRERRPSSGRPTCQLPCGQPH